jgi:uncharacterized protein
MSLKQELETALKTALRNGDNLTKQTIRMILSAIKLIEIEKGSSLDDTTIMSILQKEIKSRKETMDDAEKALRQDMIEQARMEIKIIESFLPKQLTDDELLPIIQMTITELGVSSPSDLGKVIKAVMVKVQGRASGEIISKLVRQALQK